MRHALAVIAKENLLLLVVVKSHVGNFAARQENRLTWMRLLRGRREVRVWQVVGRTDAESDPARRRRLDLEKAQHCDLVQVGRGGGRVARSFGSLIFGPPGPKHRTAANNEKSRAISPGNPVAVGRP